MRVKASCEKFSRGRVGWGIGGGLLGSGFASALSLLGTVGDEYEFGVLHLSTEDARGKCLDGGVAFERRPLGFRENRSIRGFIALDVPRAHRNETQFRRSPADVFGAHGLGFQCDQTPALGPLLFDLSLEIVTVHSSVYGVDLIGDCEDETRSDKDDGGGEECLGLLAGQETLAGASTAYALARNNSLLSHLLLRFQTCRPLAHPQLRTPRPGIHLDLRIICHDRLAGDQVDFLLRTADAFRKSRRT